MAIENRNVAVRNRMDAARQHDRAIRCVAADGTVIDYADVSDTLPDKWVRITWDDHDGLSAGRVVDPDAVVSDIRSSRPDVQTVGFDRSLFVYDPDSREHPA